jgi:MYXO-CTERM domain-containing protein
MTAGSVQATYIGNLLNGYGSNVLGYWPLQEATGVTRTNDSSANGNYALINSITSDAPQGAGGMDTAANLLAYQITAGVTGGPKSGLAMRFPGSPDLNAGTAQNNRHLEPGIANVGQAGGSSGTGETPIFLNAFPSNGDLTATPPTLVSTWDPLPGADPTKLLSGHGRYYQSGQSQVPSTGVAFGNAAQWTGGTQLNYTGGLSGSTPMTILTWVKLNSLISGAGSQQPTIMGTGRQGGGQEAWGLQAQLDGGGRFRFNRPYFDNDAAPTTNTSANFFGPAGTAVTGVWQFVAVTFDPTATSGHVKLYTATEGATGLTLNQFDDATATMPWGNAAQPGGRVFHLGGHQTRSSVDGSMAHAAVLNTVLSDAQLDALFQASTDPIPGDTAPFDGIVNLTDLNNVLNNFGASGNPLGDTFSAGIGFDTQVNLTDLNNVLNNFGATGAPAAVPEPAGLGLLAAAGLLGLRRRR